MRQELCMLRTIGKGLLFILAGTFIGAVLLWVSYLLPLTEESTHVAESVQMLEQEGWYPVVPLMYPYTGVISGINPGGALDNFTDSIMITTAGHAPVEGALYQAMNMAGNVVQNGYSYYWHGYVTVLRPLLLFLNYADIRVLNQLLQLFLVSALACQLYRRKGIPWAVLALTIYGLLLPMAISQSLQYSWVFYIGMFGSLIIVRFRNWLAEKQRITFFFLILGMITCYMDLLTYPLFTWGIPMVWWIVTGDGEEPEKRQIARVVLCGIAWVCGYGGIWIGKWLVGGAILYRSLWIQAWNEVQYRAGAVPAAEGYTATHLEVMLRNLWYYQSIQGIFLLGGWIIWWFLQDSRSSQKYHTKKGLALLLVALSPITWYVVLHNHTFVHSRFTYRIWTVSLIALLALMISSLGDRKKQKCNREKQLVSIALVAMAVMFALNLKEETYVHNGNYVPTQLELNEHMELVQEFIPSFNTVSAFNILLYAEASQVGEIEILLQDEDQVIRKITVAAELVEGGKFYELPVNLRMKQNKRYQISISGKNLEGGNISVGVTDLGLYPLDGLFPLQIDHQQYDAQLICGFHYRHQIGSRKLILAVELQLLVYCSMYSLCRGDCTERKRKME